MGWWNGAAGLGVGLLVGLTGVGGGALMTPILVLLFGVAPATAVGTDLWFAAITKLAGGAVQHRQGRVDWPVVRRLALGSLPASVLTLLWLQRAGMQQIKQGLTLDALGAVLLLTALALVFKKHTHALGDALRTRAPVPFKRAQPGLTVLAGALLGGLVTLTSIGAGALGAVLLLALYPRRMTPAVLVGTDIVHAIPLTLVAGTGHLLMGHVDWRLLANLLLGSIPGVLLGSVLGDKVAEHWLRLAIAAVLVGVGAKLLAT